MADGTPKPIEQLVVGDKVITREGRVRRVTCLHWYEHCGTMVELSFSGNNIPLTATLGHKILAIRLNWSSGRVRNPKANYLADALEWVPAGDLGRNDIVVYPRLSMESSPPILDLAQYAARLPK